MTYPNFAQGEVLNLVRACAPVYGSHKALPDALNELGFGERLIFLPTLNRTNDLAIIKSAK